MENAEKQEKPESNGKKKLYKKPAIKKYERLYEPGIGS